MTPELRITLFGQLSISYQGTVITTVKSERLQALLAYLLLHRSAPQSRQSIAITLWPESTDANAKSNLRKRLHELKKHIPDSDRYLSVLPQTVQWIATEDCWIDVSAFEGAIAQAKAQSEQTVPFLETALKIYQGELLPSCYDDWIVPLRDRLRQQAISALDTLIPLLAKQARLSEAISYAQQLQQMDPLYEPAYLHLMRLHAQSGAIAIALRTYHQCMTILREELGIDPSAKTREFHELLLRGNPIPVNSAAEKPAPPPVAEPIATPVTEPTAKSIGKPANDLTADNLIATPITTFVDWGEAPDVSFFYGRETESDQLRTWILTDRVQLMAVLGMGGIGKTSLVAKIAHDHQEDFEYVIWRSLRNAPPLNTLLGELVPFLSQQQDTVCTVPRLMHWLRQSRCLVILDNLETLLKGGERAGQFREKYENYGVLLQLLAQANHQSCLIITSREKPAEISTFEGGSRNVQSLQLAGSPEASLALLEASDLAGSQAQKELLGKRYGYSPLALQIVSGSIRDLFEGDISLFLAEDTLLFNGAKKLLDLQFERLIPLEKTVMYWLAINREWTSIAELAADIYPYRSKSKLLEALESLRWRSLIEQRGNTYTQQPVVMEYVTLCLIQAIGEELLNPGCFDEDFTDVPLLASYALLKTTAKDFIRNSQCRLIVEPILEILKSQLRSSKALTTQFQSLLTGVRRTEFFRSSYAGGNLLNLCCQGQLYVADIDFSQLTIRHAFLQDATLHHLNLSHTTFVQSVFTQSFGIALSVAFSPDGTLLAMGDNNHNVQLWRIGDRQPLMTLRGHRGWVWSVAFSPDGKTLVSGSVDYTARLWDVDSGECLKTLQGHNSVVWSVAFSADGQTVASGSEDQTAKVWQVETGNCVQTLTVGSGCVRSVTFHPQGKTLITGHTDQSTRLWDIQSGNCLHNFEGHMGPVWAVSLSPNGQVLASAGADQTIRLWEVASGHCLQVLEGHSDQIWAVAFSPDGKALASGSNDRTVRLWNIEQNIETSSCVMTFLGHSDQVWSVAFSPDGQQLASGGFDQTIRLRDLTTYQCLQTLSGYTNCIRSLAFDPESKTLISGGDDTLIRLWDSETTRCTQTLKGHRSGVWAVAYQAGVQASKDQERSHSNLIATGGFDQTIRLWDSATGQCIKVLESRAGWIHSLAFNPNKPLLASGSIAPIVQVWDLETGECAQQLQGHRDQIWSVAFSPDGQYLASTGADHEVKLWDVETGECVRTFLGHTDWMYAVAFVPVSETDTSATNTTVSKTDSSKTDQPAKYHLASASGDRTVRLWDIQTGGCLRTFSGHDGWVYSLAAHPSRPILVSSSHDHTARIWDVQTGQCRHVLPHKASLWAMAFHPKEGVIACSGEDEEITLWDVETGAQRKHFQIAKPYMGMKITDISGLTEEQKSTLKELGASE